MDYQGPGGRGCFNCRWWLAFYLLPSFVSPQPCTISTRPIAFVGFPPRSLARSKERAILCNGFKQNLTSFLLFASLLLVIGCLWGGEDFCNISNLYVPPPPQSTSVNTAANKSLRQVEIMPIKPATAQSVARQHATTVARKAM